MPDGPATNEETKTLRMSKHIQGDFENQKFIFFVFWSYFQQKQYLKMHM